MVCCKAEVDRFHAHSLHPKYTFKTVETIITFYMLIYLISLISLKYESLAFKKVYEKFLMLHYCEVSYCA